MAQSTRPVGRRELEIWSEAERRRLVRLCARLSGDRDAAEDLAQETLLEAWRNAHKLHDPAGADRWLTAVARNVCLRWARTRWSLPVLEAADAERLAAGSEDLELVLERDELAELLDRALALVPPATRDVLVHRYVHGSSHAEIAESLGLSADAVSMRLSRGKVVLRRVLRAELHDEAAAYGLAGTNADGWRETGLWCAQCGVRRLLFRPERAPGGPAFRCPGCSPGEALSSEFRLSNPVFAGLLESLVRPSAILARAAEWSSRYFAGGRGGEPVACTRCGRATPLQRYVRDEVPPDRTTGEGLHATCVACGEEVSSSLGGLALAQPAVRRFRQKHPRTRALPMRAVAEREGVPALVLRVEDVLGSSGVDVVFARDSLRVLDLG